MKLFLFLNTIAFIVLGCSSPNQETEKKVIDFTGLPVSKSERFTMEGYWIWCGSVIKVNEVYHMFASRWVKNSQFPENYRQDSEIVRATSVSPTGPYLFKEVVIGERDKSFWDSNMAHNPTIHKIGNKFVLFYIGSDFNTFLPGTNSLLRRVGYATADNITGPWIRSDRPLVNDESNNPAILVEEDKIKLMYRDQKLKVFLAESNTFEGPFSIINNNVWPENKVEDFYLFKTNDTIHLVCEDNEGGISGHVRWGVHLFSDDEGITWQKYDPVIAYDHELLYDDGTSLNCTRRERPQLLNENGELTLLITAIYDGKDSWSQPVKLKTPIKLK